ncbi:MAG TPA: (p)ppGpp synthetase [Desulfobulbaceae bacterium]|nr:(p)ppGpp synthetase [Desulfobulbaceae bacterium]
MTPLFSKNRINRIGEILTDAQASSAERDEALALLSEWRSLHWYPLSQFYMMLSRNHVPKIEPTGIVAQRLKRLPTIIDKLKNRQQTMKLARMQDIGGLRVILSSVTKIRRLEERIGQSRWKHQQRLNNRRDYITEPRSSGYRGIHLVYEYQSATKPEYDGLLIEIQLRTRLQHLWATAVETVGFFYQESLKSSLGSDMWLDFFRLASALFALEEKQRPATEFQNESKEALSMRLREYMERNSILDLFRAIPLLSAKFSTNKGVKYLLLRTDSKTVSVIPFEKEIEANAVYGELEQSANSMGGIVQVALVSVNNLKKLSWAYPNFLLNTSDFLKHLDKMLR